MSPGQGKVLYLTQQDIMAAARRCAEDIVHANARHGRGITALYGIPRGGIPAAYAVHAHLQGSIMVDDPGEASVLVDDVVDSGETRRRFEAAYPQARFHALFTVMRKPGYTPPWLVFPWESGDGGDASADDIPRRLLQFIGENPDREGLRNTPARFIRAWREYTSGYDIDPTTLLTVFQDGAERVDEMVLVRDIPIYSHCEHHLAPFFGVAHIGYVPAGKVLGLSKIARVAEVFARRLQVQERLTTQIAHALNDALVPKGVGVVIECRHLCMEARGVRARGTTTTTSCLLGVMKSDASARAEFMGLVK